MHSGQEVNALAPPTAGYLLLPSPVYEEDDTEEVSPVALACTFMFDDWSYENLRLKQDGVVLLLIVDHDVEPDPEVYLLESEWHGFEVALWPGNYSFVVFVLDEDAPTITDATIWAFGHPIDEQEGNINPVSIEDDSVMVMYIQDADEFNDLPAVFGEVFGLGEESIHGGADFLAESLDELLANNFTSEQIADKLRELYLPVSGTKSERIQRLVSEGGSASDILESFRVPELQQLCGYAEVRSGRKVDMVERLIEWMSEGSEYDDQD